MTIEGNGSQPLYRQVANRIVENIASGTYPVGRLIPTEQEMSEEFGVSRHTVREAVRHVMAQGLVSRRQGQGTLVRQRQPRRDTSIMLRTFSDVEQHGYYTHLVDLDTRMTVADATLAAELHAAPGDRFLHLRSSRVPADDSVPIPAAWNETFIIGEYAAIAEHIGRAEGPIYLLIERLFGETIEEIEQAVSAVLLDAKVAAKLRVKSRSAGLRVKRSYRGKKGRTVMTGYNTYAGERFAISMTMRQGG
jgi:DNA-binding GntR family transcriptional regulator